MNVFRRGDAYISLFALQEFGAAGVAPTEELRSSHIRLTRRCHEDAILGPRHEQIGLVELLITKTVLTTARNIALRTLTIIITLRAFDSNHASRLRPEVPMCGDSFTTMKPA